MKPTTLTAIGNESLRSSQPEPEKMIPIPDDIASIVQSIAKHADDATKEQTKKIDDICAEEKRKREEQTEAFKELDRIWRAAHPSPEEQAAKEEIIERGMATLARRTEVINDKENRLHNRLSMIENNVSPFRRTRSGT